MQTAIGQRHGERRLGFQEQMLDALRRPGAGDHMRRGGQRRVHVAARIARDRQDVRMPGIHLRRARLDRFGGVEHGRQHLVLYFDEMGGFARDAHALGGHRGNHVADAAHLFALGDEARPVGKDLADPAVARHVPRGRHRGDAGNREGLRGVDPNDPGARVRRQHDSAIQHVRNVDVGNERPRAQRQSIALIAPQALADAAVVDHRRQGATLLSGLDRARRHR